jgi:hypothetical protein
MFQAQQPGCIWLVRAPTGTQTERQRLARRSAATAEWSRHGQVGGTQSGVTNPFSWWFIDPLFLHSTYGGLHSKCIMNHVLLHIYIYLSLKKKIYTHVYGRGSKCKALIHTLDQAFHSPDPYQATLVYLLSSSGSPRKDPYRCLSHSHKLTYHGTKSYNIINAISSNIWEL